MDGQVDHYAVLGLPSGEEGAKLTKEAINKAYKKKALELYPDKRLGDDKAQAHADFQQLAASHKILMNEEDRKSFDEFVRDAFAAEAEDEVESLIRELQEIGAKIFSSEWQE